jgi:hypothetical protein
MAQPPPPPPPAAAAGWNASVARQDITNAAVFSADRGGAGVWAGQGVTRTAPSPTLFVAGIPRGARREDVEALFRGEVGFKGCRFVGRMVFVDFTSTSFALAAMRRHQGKVLGKDADAEALVIDFDRDARAGERARHRDSQRDEQEAEKRRTTLMMYYCIVCRTAPAFVLVPSDGTVLMGMPRRGTDGAYCVDEEKYLKHIDLAEKAEPVLIKRDKGIERRYELCCRKCGLPVAYRPVPLAQPSKYLYVLADAVCWSKNARLPADKWVAEARRRAGGGGGGAGARAAGGAGGASASSSAAGGDDDDDQVDDADADYGYAAPPPSAAVAGGDVSSSSTASSSSGATSSAATPDMSSWPAALRARAEAALRATGAAPAAAPSPTPPPTEAAAVEGSTAATVGSKRAREEGGDDDGAEGGDESAPKR